MDLTGFCNFSRFSFTKSILSQKKKIHNRITGITIKEWAATVALLKKIEFFLVLNYCFDRFTLKIKLKNKNILF
jgi:hypothetical protein